ncbi:hypothetical protein [Pseudooceanicola spongiae]|nr:hypothetical protein [Pseudooceanicola spongiae]
MSINDVSPAKGQRGQARMQAICDSCMQEEVFPCARGDFAEARRKLGLRGWAEVGGTLRCPTCEARRRAHAVVPVTVATEAPPKPTREQKRQIMELLGESYDTTAGRYRKGDTDAVVAEVLGFPQRPGWVAQIREEFFGADGGNDEIASLSAQIAALQAAETKLEKALAELCQEREALHRDAATMAASLASIRAAVGPQALRRAQKGAA